MSKRIEIVPKVTPEEMAHFYELTGYVDEHIAAAGDLDLEIVATFFEALREGLGDTSRPLLLSAQTAYGVTAHLLAERYRQAAFGIRRETHLHMRAAELLAHRVTTSLTTGPSSLTEKDTTVEEEVEKLRSTLLDAAPAPLVVGTDVTLEASDPIQRLAAALRTAHEMAGSPSYRRLERQARHTISAHVGSSAAVICRCLNGKQLPTWELTEGLLEIFGIGQEKIRTTWHAMWVEARRFQNGTVTSSGGASAPPAPRDGHECPTCGCWVVNDAVHATFHNNIEEQLRLLRAAVNNSAALQ